MDEHIESARPTSPLRVVADDREAGSGVVEALRRTTGAEVVVERLSLGDYDVDGKLLFERKTLNDLAISIVDGRLFSQMTRLVQSPRRAALILEGTARDIRDSGVSRESIQGALVNVTLLLGVPVLRSTCPGETARIMLYAARQLRALSSGSIIRQGYRPKGKRKRQLYILQGLPGIGPKRAAQLLEIFGSVEGVMRASFEELAEVPGIGGKTAEEIRSVVGESAEDYRTLADELDV